MRWKALCSKAQCSKALCTKTRGWVLLGGVALAGVLIAGATPRRALADDFVRGDCAVDGSVGIVDAIRMLEYLIGVAVTLDCADACDANDDGSIDIVDPLYVLYFSFGTGSVPAPPFPGCGGDSSAADPFDCALSPLCP